MMQLVHFLFGLLLVQYTLAQCPNAAERLAHAVELTFYRAQVDQWASDGNSAKVAVQVSAKATSYCGANPAACGLSNCCTPAFKETDVGTESGYPQNSLKDMKLKIYVDIPTGNNASGTPQCVLSKTVVQTLVDLARDDIHTETDHWITYIDDEFYGIPPATELNKVIIPIAFVILIGIAGLTIGLNIWKKRRDSEARRMKIIEDRKKHSKAKVQPTYHVDTTETKVPPGIDEKNKDELYRESLRQKLREAKTSADSPVKTASEPYQRQGYAFERSHEVDSSQGATSHDGNSYGGQLHQMHRTPRESEKVPLTHLTPIQTDPASDVQSPEKKKKKKKKRSKSKENMNVQENGGSDVQGRENAAYDY